MFWRKSTLYWNWLLLASDTYWKSFLVKRESSYYFKSKSSVFYEFLSLMVCTRVRCSHTLFTPALDAPFALTQTHTHARTFKSIPYVCVDVCCLCKRACWQMLFQCKNSPKYQKNSRCRCLLYAHFDFVYALFAAFSSELAYSFDFYFFLLTACSNSSSFFFFSTLITNMKRRGG